MMMAYELDENNFYIGFVDLSTIQPDEQGVVTYPNHSRVQMTIGYYKPRFNFDTQDWEEGATEQEIEDIKAQQPVTMEEVIEEIFVLGEYENSEANQVIKRSIEGAVKVTGYFELGQQIKVIEVEPVSGTFQDGEIYFENGRVDCVITFKGTDITIDSAHRLVKLMAEY